MKDYLSIEKKVVSSIDSNLSNGITKSTSKKGFQRNLSFGRSQKQKTKNKANPS